LNEICHEASRLHHSGQCAFRPGRFVQIGGSAIDVFPCEQSFGFPADTILSALQKRESLGSTGIGQGIAIPHTRISGIEKPIGVLARLEKPIDFESIDDMPVDIVLVLLTPDQESNKHLNVLACVARKLRSPVALEQMRAAKDAQSLYARFVAEP
jgi:PTS system nitrogen regulatory IIA component